MLYEGQGGRSLFAASGLAVTKRMSPRGCITSHELSRLVVGLYGGA